MPGCGMGGERGEAGFAARPLWPEKQEDAEGGKLLSTPDLRALPKRMRFGRGKHSQAMCSQVWGGLVYAARSVLSGQDVGSAPLLLSGPL